VHFNPDGGDSGLEKKNLELFVRAIRAHLSPYIFWW